MEIINIISSIGVAFSLIGDIFVMFKKKIGYIFWILGNIIMGYNFIVLQRNIPMVFLQSVYIILNAIGFVRWAIDDKKINKETYVYDLDGVLIDAEDYNRWWCIENISTVNVDIWKEKYVGRELKLIFKDLLKDSDLYKNRVEERVEELTKYYEREFKDVLQKKDKDNPIKINQCLIDEIKSNNKNNIIITSRDKKQAKEIIQYCGIKKYISHIYSGENNKFININNAFKKYNIFKAYDDVAKVIDKYVSLGIDAVYVKHKYNNNIIGVNTIGFVEKVLDK